MAQKVKRRAVFSMKISSNGQSASRLRRDPAILIKNQSKKAGESRTLRRRQAIPRYVYFFGAGKADGSAQMRALLGGKGANLAEMTRIGLPVPPGFTITTEICTYYYAHKLTYPKILDGQVEAAIARLEALTGKKFGDTKNPLLVSVRSGARESMPGMMDTILNLGLNDVTVEVLAKRSGNPRFAWDKRQAWEHSYLRPAPLENVSRCQTHA